MGRVTRKLTLDRAKARRWGVACAVAMLLFGLQVAGATPSSAATGKTVGSGSVPVYSGPGSANSKTGSVPVGTTVSFHCFVAGQRVSGPYGTEDLWDALDSGGYAPDALIYTGSNSAVVPACRQPSSAPVPIRSRGRGAAAHSRDLAHRPERARTER